MLLDFPPELLELILSFLDPPSFSILLLTSKVLRHKILNGGHAFHTQLKALPGLHQCRPGTCETNVQQLLPLYCQRAAEHAMNGVSVLCDITTYRAQFPVRFKLGQLERLEAHHDPHELVAAVDADSATVHVYSLQPGFPLPRHVIQPHLFQLEGDRLKVLLVKLHEQDSKRHITILYKYTLNPVLDIPENHFQAEAHKKSTHTLKLATYALSPSQGVSLVTLRDITSKDMKYAPVAMEVSTSGEVIIVFRMLPFPDTLHYKIKSYSATASLVDVSPCCVNISSGTGPRTETDSDIITLEEPIVSVSLSEDKHLRLYSSRNQMPRYQINDCFDSGARLDSLSQPSLRKIDSFFGSYRWLPLGTGHNHKCITNSSGATCCISTILQLAFIKSSGSRRPGISSNGFYLVKGSVDSDNCMRLDTDKPFPQLEHEIVGCLTGIDIQKMISHGHIIAVSESSKRIAIATWDRVQLFSIEPDAFLSQLTGSLQYHWTWTKKPVKRRSLKCANRTCEYSHDEDYTYSINCGQGYYKTYTRLFGRRIVALEPVELPNRGVVHKLYFTEDDTLWAWTDRGLIKWYWGPGRKARRFTKELFPGPSDFDAPVGSQKARLQVPQEDAMDLD